MIEQLTDPCAQGAGALGPRACCGAIAHLDGFKFLPSPLLPPTSKALASSAVSQDHAPPFVHIASTYVLIPSPRQLLSSPCRSQSL